MHAEIKWERCATAIYLHTCLCVCVYAPNGLVRYCVRLSWIVVHKVMNSYYMHQLFDCAGFQTRPYTRPLSKDTHTLEHMHTNVNKKSFETLNRERLFESAGLLWRLKCAHTDVFCVCRRWQTGSQYVLTIYVQLWISVYFTSNATNVEALQVKHSRA